MKLKDFLKRIIKPKEVINKKKPTKEQTLQQMFRFFWFSVSAGVIQTVSFTILHEVFNLKYWVAYLPALVLSVIWNFTLNRKFTFKSVANIPRAMFKLTVYYAIFTPASTWWGNALDLIGWNAYLILFVTMVSNLITEYLVNRLFIYHNKMYTAEIVKEEKLLEESNIETEKELAELQ